MPAPEAAAPESAAVPAAEPAQAPERAPEAFSFENAFGPAALNARPTTAEPPAETDDDAEEPAQATEPAVSKPASTGDEPEPAPSRRAKAAQAHEAERQTWAEREAELKAELKANWESERQAREATQRELDARQLKQQELLQQVAAEVGPQDEFDRLSRLPSSALTYEQQEQLDGWKVAREKVEPQVKYAEQVARANLNAGLLSEAARLAELPGMSAEAIQSTGANSASPFEDLCRAFYETGAAQSADRITALEAELTDLRTQRAASARPLEKGGTSVGPQVAPNPNTFDPTLPIERQWEQAFMAPPRRRAS